MDNENNRTLTERVANMESFLREVGYEGEPLGVAGQVDYRDAQKERNRILSERIIHRDMEGAAGPDRTNLEEIARRVQSAVDNAHLIAERLESIGDRLYGSRNEKAGEAASTVARGIEMCGTFEQVHVTLGWLDAVLERVENAQRRLECI